MDSGGRQTSAFAAIAAIALFVGLIGVLGADVSNFASGSQTIEAVRAKPAVPMPQSLPDQSPPSVSLEASGVVVGTEPPTGDSKVEVPGGMATQTGIPADDAPGLQIAAGSGTEVASVRSQSVETEPVEDAVGGSQPDRTSATVSTGLDEMAVGTATSGQQAATGDGTIETSVSANTAPGSSQESSVIPSTTILNSKGHSTATSAITTTSDAPPTSSRGLSPSASSPVTTQPNPAQSPSSSALSTTRPSTSLTTTTLKTTTEISTTSQTVPVNQGLEALRNNNPKFDRYGTIPSDRLDLAELTEVAPVRDNGTVGDGQFRAACQYSHFSYDDPIVFPGQPGEAHLHMFFGNTETDAFSTTDSIVNSGGGSCNGFELNRSAYWTPALLDGRGNIVVPDMIVLYYKSKAPEEVQRMPQGLKMLSGNTTAESFTVSDFLYWSCGESGKTYNKSNRIPDCGGDTINATIAFPQCWDGVNLDSADHRSHLAMVSPHKPCPTTHPVRLPQISILLYYPGDGYTKDWLISSDQSGGFNTSGGATLHADWWGGWNDEAMDLWTDGCMKAARNCSFGQTGTDRQLAKLNNFQNYPGQNVLPLP